MPRPKLPNDRLSGFLLGKNTFTVRNRHYLDKEKMADRFYAERLMNYLNITYNNMD